MKTLLIRTLTGALFVIVMLVSVCWSFYSLFAILTVIMILAIHEFFNLRGLPNLLGLKIIVILAGLLFLAASFSISLGFIPPSLLLIPAFLVVSLLIITGLSGKKSFIKYSIPALLALFYILLPLCLIPFLVTDNKTGSYQPALLISIFIIIWCYDSFAYLTGVLAGKHKMFPALSPKKTWEGFAGGVVFAILTALIISHFNLKYNAIQWVIISLIIAVAGTAGDFFESFLKRKAGVKDSGNWLPGHGGILDRFDSFLFAIPFVFIYIYFLIS